MSSAGLLGAVGVGLAAAGTHSGGGDLAGLAAYFLLIHAVALLGLSACAAVCGDRVDLMGAGAIVLIAGVICFSGDIAALAFTGRHVAPGLAPLGGLALIAGWLIIAASPWVRRKQV